MDLFGAKMEILFLVGVLFGALAIVYFSQRHHHTTCAEYLKRMDRTAK